LTANQNPVGVKEREHLNRQKTTARLPVRRNSYHWFERAFKLMFFTS